MKEKKQWQQKFSELLHNIEGYIKKNLVQVIVWGCGVLAFLVGLFPIGEIGRLICYALATALIGSKVILSVFKGLLKLRLDAAFLPFIAMIASFAVGHYYDGFYAMIFYMIGVHLIHLTVDISRQNLEKVYDICPEIARLQDQRGHITEVPVEKVAVGDRFVVPVGSRVPVDAQILKGSSTIDPYALKGESIPVSVEEGDIILSGTINRDAELVCEAIRTFQNSAAYKIVNTVHQALKKPSSTQRFIHLFARIFVPVVILLAILISVLPPFLGFGSFQQWIAIGAMFLAISSPLSLLKGVPLAFFSGISIAARRGILFKAARHMDTLARAGLAIFEKTGVLTKGVLNVTKVQSVGRMSDQEILNLAAAAESYSNHAIARAISRACKKPENIVIMDHEELEGLGVVATMIGKRVICGSKRLMEQEHVNIGDIEADVYLATDDTLQGVLYLTDMLREDAQKTVQTLIKMGIKKTVLLTGDNPQAAAKVVYQTGIHESHSLLLNHDKLYFLQQAGMEDDSVLYVGDGVSDASVMASADVGLAMGLGNNLDIDTVDVILMSNRIFSVVDAIKISRRTVWVARFNIVFSILVKLLMMLFSLLGFIGLWEIVFLDALVSTITVLTTIWLFR